MDDYDLVVDDFLQCDGCGKHPSQLPEYDNLGYGTRPAGCWNEEGTLNRKTGRFLCNWCYMGAGMPSSPDGWKVGD